MDLPTAIQDRLDRLAPDQRAAATAPPGPVLCVAPAGSGKTTTLVARIGWLLATGAARPGTVTAITFNRRAAEELSDRLAALLPALAQDERAVRVRTFHALGLEILRDAGQPVAPLLDRGALVRELWPDVDGPARRRIDDALSRLKLDRGVTAEALAREPGDVEPALVAAFAQYEAAIRDAGGLDFDDLVARALALLEGDAGVRATWRQRCAHLLVDEVQDVDRAQLRLALLLAAPENRVFLVGDDDQSIYGWRLADVRRVLTLAGDLPGLRRIDLETNYRCPAPVVERAVRLVEQNRERFVKRIRARRQAPGRLVLAPDGSDEPERLRRVLASWPLDDGSRAVLARTNRELLPALDACLVLGLRFRAPRLRLLVEDDRVDAMLDAAVAARADGTRADVAPPLPTLGRLRDAVLDGRWRRVAAAPAAASRHGAPDADVAGDPRLETDPDDEPDGSRPTDAELVGSLLAWAAPYPTLGELRRAIEARRERLGQLRRDDATLTLATAHGTKGLEFDHVAVVGLESSRFPSARTLADSAEPGRALEEERRLAYVAWTRARRSLTLSYDAAVPSPFLLEAFSPEELGLA